MNILVVDDERFNLVMAKDIIEPNVADSTTILCSKPEQVMKLLEQNNIDIILLDIIMPEINGIEILKEIRSKDTYKDIQILMFTGVTDKESFRICFELGANDFISKPIDITEFVARLQAAVKTRNNTLMLKSMFSKLAEQYNQLEEMTHKLQETQFHLVHQEKLASLGEIAAGVAHEINNPIGFIGSNLETLEKYLAKIRVLILAYQDFSKLAADESSSNNELLAARQQLEKFEQQINIAFLLDDFEPIMQESKEGVDRIAKIVQGLRNFARTGTEDERNINDLNMVIEEALLITRNELKYHTVVEKNLAPSAEIICNRVQISQVLVNILINAAQAIKSQERDSMGKIIVETSQEGEDILCRISDDGPGIKAENIGRIFDPFFTTKDVGNGTGLGLSIAYGIIKKHCGEFSVESQPGKGATFIIKLPIHSEDCSL